MEEEPGEGVDRPPAVSQVAAHLVFPISMISTVAPSPSHTSMGDILQFSLSSARICLLVWP